MIRMNPRSSAIAAAAASATTRICNNTWHRGGCVVVNSSSHRCCPSVLRIQQHHHFRQYSSNSSSPNHSNTSTAPKVALVLGSSGALGSTVSRYLSRSLGMHVIGADVVETPFNDTDWELDGFIPVPHCSEKPSIADVTSELTKGVHILLGETESIDTIVCASGGWQPDAISAAASSSTIDTETLLYDGAHMYGENIDKMICMNLYPVVAAGYTAQNFMGPNGLFVVIGATAALSATPGMIGYGLSKTSVHHFVQTLGACTGHNSLEHKSIRKKGNRVLRQYQQHMDTLTVVGILPTTIDTPSNRIAMPTANFDEWTKPLEIAEEIGSWIQTPQIRPHSGCLVKVSSNHEGTVFDIVR